MLRKRTNELKTRELRLYAVEKNGAYYEPKVMIHEKDLGPLAEGFARLRMKKVSICGSDRHIMSIDDSGKIRSTVPKSIDGGGRILGHEGVGEVLELSSNFTTIEVGDHVSLESIFTCGTCERCRAGCFNQCLSAKLMGFEFDGLFSEIVDVPIRLLFDISRKNPTDWDLEMACCLEPMSVAFLSVLNSGFPVGGKAMVLGGGPLGLYAAFFFKRSFGALETTIVETSRYRRKVAGEEFVSVATRIEDVMGTFDAIVDTTGNPEVIDSAVSVMNPNTTMVLLARTGKPIVISRPDLLISGNLCIKGVRGHLGGIFERVWASISNPQNGFKSFLTTRLTGLEDISRLLRLTNEEVVGHHMKIIVSLP